MLGRTHMSIGAIGAVAAEPLIIHANWQPMSRLLDNSWGAIPHIVIAQAVLMVASVVGSIMPDLDQSDSLMAHKIESLGRLILMAILAGLVVLLHLVTSITAWAVVVLLGVLLGAKNNITRMAGLGVLAVAIGYVSWENYIPLIAGALLVAWIVGAAFTPHRTFTHSLLGLAIFAVGVYMSIHGLRMVHRQYAVYGLVLGYGLHLVADAVAGGIPLLWPWGQRVGVRLVRTGSAVDHLIGGIALFGFAALAVL